jgi:hypothetical protein
MRHTTYPEPFLWLAVALIAMLFSGCGGPALGGKPAVERHEYPQDGVVCYVATGYGPRNFEIDISCVKVKE